MNPSHTRLFSLGVLALLTAGLATSNAQSPTPESRVTVTGVGEVRVAPDMALLTVEASNKGSSPLSASNDTRKDMNQILGAVRKLVRDSVRDLRTTRISVNPEYEWTDGKRKFRGFTASQTLEITVFDVSKIEALLDAVMNKPVSTLGNLEFRHTKADSLGRAASALAMQNAAENARSLCGAAKRSCEELVGVRMGGAAGPGPFPGAEFKAARMMGADAGGGMPVQPGVLAFVATVDADYLLKRDVDIVPVPAPKKMPPAPSPQLTPDDAVESP
jgi:uncharacterized protein YggE